MLMSWLLMSLNLAIFNLLPIPILDWWRVVIYAFGGKMVMGRGA